MSEVGASSPSITCTVNGPYRVTSLPALRNSRGDDLPVTAAVFLCRCGGSANKPFCDGTHAKNGFSSERLRKEPPSAERDTYQGDGVTILDNRSVCAHAGYCTDRLPSVWKTGAEPWIDPAGADAQSIIETIGMCPSGALSFAVDGIEREEPNRPPLITVSKDGPYYVVGSPTLSDEITGQQPQSSEHFTLCRCGQSSNKPFCDGTHWYIGFHDEKN